MVRNPGELRYQPLAEAAALDVWEPRGGYALVTCKISVRTGIHEKWEPRTYEFRYVPDGWRQGGWWCIDTNPGYLRRESWESVVSWFCRMCPVDIELLTTV